jgi:RNA polymerase sigma-70 factor (ECF subfamily)
MNEQEYIRSRFRIMTDDRNLCEELTQLTNIKIFKNKYTWTNDYSFKKLINSIAKSVYIDYYRSKNKKNKTIFELLDDDMSSSYNADDKLNKKETDKLIAKLLDKLTEPQKDAVILRYFFGLNYKKIAKLMNCPFNTALSHIYYAKKKLKTILW